MKNKFRIKFLALKRVFASGFLLLNIIFLYLCCIFFANCANADVIYSRRINEESNFFQKKIELAFDNLKNFNEYIEPKSEFSNSFGEKISLQDFRGENIILYFWASWCKSCVEEIKMLQKLKDELAFQSINNIKIIPISIDYKSINEVKANISGAITDLEVYRDDYKELMDALKVKSVPTAFFIDSRGYVIYRIEGEMEWSNNYLLTKLKELFKITKSDDGAIQTKVLNENQNDQKSNDSNSKEAIITPNNKTIFIN